jgi:hypothetical protein
MVVKGQKPKPSHQHGGDDNNTTMPAIALHAL